MATNFQNNTLPAKGRLWKANRDKMHTNQSSALQSHNRYPNENNRRRQYGHNLYPGTLHTAKKVVGMPNKYKIFTSGEGRRRAAVVVTNSQIDTMLINQLSVTDTVTVEVIKGSLKFIIISMYFDGGNPIQRDLVKIEAVLQHAKGKGVLIVTADPPCGSIQLQTREV
jgi:hypothetical protein